MFIHPVNVIIILSVVALGSFAWILISARRRRITETVDLAGAPEVASLRRRIAVLEEIVTDPGIRLDREIEELRSAS